MSRKKRPHANRPEAPPAASVRAPAVGSSGHGVSALVVLAVATLICLVPFAGKAFHIDDPLFLWVGRYIQAHPTDPYGFSINWYGSESPISKITKNPPLNSYYLALLGSLFGWKEVPLHLGFLVPALGAVLGTHLLARDLCRHPLLAGICMLLTPVFLVSSTNVMADTMLLALWTLAIYFWSRGLRLRSGMSLAVSGLLIGLATLTKYFGLFLIPLLLVYSLAKWRRLRWDLLYLLVPILMLGVYQWVTQRIYGRGLLMDAFSYASQTSSPYGRWSLAKMLVGLDFTGGCMAVVACFAYRLWPRTGLAIGLAAAASVALLVGAAGSIGNWTLSGTGASWLLAIQFGIWVGCGFGVLALSVGDIMRHRDAEALLLLLWVMGTVGFAIFGNWTTNGRVLLPIAPAVAILLARRLMDRGILDRSTGIRSSWVPLVAAGVLSLAVAGADTALANSARRAAQEICGAPHARPRTIWFEGHWGFQYYMEESGARAVVLNRSSLDGGDLLVLPRNNTSVVWPAPPWTRPRKTHAVPAGRWLTTMSQELGAGFYSDFRGPLPFSVGAVPPETYEVFEVAGVADSTQ
jgi:4-amino-4-deoxy-L-arabinose transferase-like glycosyltransferase